MRGRGGASERFGHDVRILECSQHGEPGAFAQRFVNVGERQYVVLQRGSGHGFSSSGKRLRARADTSQAFGPGCTNLIANACGKLVRRGSMAITMCRGAGICSPRTQTRAKYLLKSAAGE